MGNYYIFVIDTPRYAGNFSRQLTSWCTGVVGDCGVGAEYAEAFHAAYQADSEVIEESDLRARVRGVVSRALMSTVAGARLLSTPRQDGVTTTESTGTIQTDPIQRIKASASSWSRCLRPP